MRSLIIVRGLVKKNVDAWIKREGLLNFYVDIENVRKLFYRPEYKGTRDFLVHSYDEAVYKIFMESLVSHFSSGCLVVVWLATESSSVIEDLATFFGYKVFYHVESTPVDYVGKYRNYGDSQYLQPTKETLRKEVDKFRSLRIDKWRTINTYSELENQQRIKIFRTKGEILHISDLHSNHETFLNIVKGVKHDFCICLGDYIDGPVKGGSRKMIDEILNNNRKNIVFLEGNHESRLRKLLGYLYFSKKDKNVVSRVLLDSIPQDFFKTAAEFDDLENPLEYMKALNKKLKEAFLYSKDGRLVVCTHSGVRWIDQISPKFIGNVICSNRNPVKIDLEFSKKYYEEGLVSVHGHCKYDESMNFNRFPGVYNLDVLKDDEVNYMIGDSIWTIKT